MPVFDFQFAVHAPLAAVQEFHHDTSALKRLTPPPTIVQLHERSPWPRAPFPDSLFGLVPCRYDGRRCTKRSPKMVSRTSKLRDLPVGAHPHIHADQGRRDRDSRAYRVRAQVWILGPGDASSVRSAESLFDVHVSEAGDTSPSTSLGNRSERWTEVDSTRQCSPSAPVTQGDWIPLFAWMSLAGSPVPCSATARGSYAPRCTLRTRGCPTTSDWRSGSLRSSRRERGVCRSDRSWACSAVKTCCSKRNLDPHSGLQPHSHHHGASRGEATQGNLKGQRGRSENRTLARRDGFAGDLNALLWGGPVPLTLHLTD